MNDKEFLKLAVEQAKKSVEGGGFPAGSILVKNGEVIGEGISIGFLLNDPTSHSDSAVIREICNKLKTTDLSGFTLYSSVQPCLMCFSCANWANISKIVYACRKTEKMVKKFYYEGNSQLEKINEENNKKIELVFIPDFEKEMLELIKTWESKF